MRKVSFIFAKLFKSLKNKIYQSLQRAMNFGRNFAVVKNFVIVKFYRKSKRQERLKAQGFELCLVEKFIQSFV